jgi:acetyltransferase-like isoleucine patch superfamily enzyme
MISYGVTVRTSDSHAIIDLVDQHQINLPDSVVIQPHVWIGAHSIIGKGQVIGRCSIIGERSVVTRSVPWLECPRK